MIFEEFTANADVGADVYKLDGVSRLVRRDELHKGDSVLIASQFGFMKTKVYTEYVDDAGGEQFFAECAHWLYPLAYQNGRGWIAITAISKEGSIFEGVF